MASILLERPKINRPKRRDLKPKRVYASAVTVCIAAACQEQGQPRIVLCSDSRLDWAEFGSTNSTVKLDVLGYGWCSQLAGEWSGVFYFNSLLRHNMQDRESAPTKLSEVEDLIQDAIQEFCSSALHDEEQVYDVLISGFLQETPIVMDVRVQKPDPKFTLAEPFYAIGSGGNIASIILRLREYHSSMNLSYATYLVYESKRSAEHDGTVGRFTALAVQAPGSELKGRAYLKIMNELGKAHLEAVYAGLWSVPFATIPDFTPDFFDDPKR